MRLHYSDVTGHRRQYADWLSKLSYDPILQDDVSLPAYIHRASQLDDLYEQVFPHAELHNTHQNPDSWRSRAILTPFNDTVVANDGLEISVENLQELECTGMPSSKLHLKLGAPVILLRNLDQMGGLNNGSRMTLTRIGRYSLEGGDPDGELRIIPRIPLTSIEGDFLSF